MENEENEIAGLHKKQGTSDQSISTGTQHQTSAKEEYKAHLERQKNTFQ